MCTLRVLSTGTDFVTPDVCGSHELQQANNPVNPQLYPAPFNNSAPIAGSNQHPLPRFQQITTGQVPWYGIPCKAVGVPLSGTRVHHKLMLATVVDVLPDRENPLNWSGLKILLHFNAPYTHVPNASYDYDHICQQDNNQFLDDNGTGAKTVCDPYFAFKPGYVETYLFCKEGWNWHEQGPKWLEEGADSAKVPHQFLKSSTTFLHIGLRIL